MEVKIYFTNNLINSIGSKATVSSHLCFEKSERDDCAMMMCSICKENLAVVLLPR